uniref:Uncharacterized protein n=1 Tax=Panagrolaimus davidi TaxID=227884 RepID=A0A914PBE2_9BILA
MFFFDYFAAKRSEELLEKCQIRENGTYVSDNCYNDRNCKFCKAEAKTDLLYKVLNFISTWLGYFWHFKSPLFIFISTFATILIIGKIGKQSLFQIKHNRKDFYNSLRISGVIILQTIFNLFIFSIEIIEALKALLYELGFSYISDNMSDETAKKYPNDLDLRVFPWFSSNFGLSSSQSFQMIIQLRILMESLLVLFVMTGYRESLILFFKIICFKIRYPKKSHKEIMSQITQTVTKVSNLNK